jgi:quinol monooxygenase YgiN
VVLRELLAYGQQTLDEPGWIVFEVTQGRDDATIFKVYEAFAGHAASSVVNSAYDDQPGGELPRTRCGSMM